jgi:hypothetical protein
MIKADVLKFMVDACGKILDKTDVQAVGVKKEGSSIEVYTASRHRALKMVEPLEGDAGGADFDMGINPFEFSRLLGVCDKAEIGLKEEGTTLLLSGPVDATICTHEHPPTIKIQTDSEYSVSAEWFRRCCVLSPRFAATDSARFALKTAHFELEDGVLTFVSTDGRKAVYSNNGIHVVKGAKEFSVNIDSDDASVIGSIFPQSMGDVKCQIEVGETGFRATMGNVSFWTIQPSGEFPSDWREIFPAPEYMVPIDGKRLAKFNDMLRYLEAGKTKFVSDGNSLKIYAGTETVPRIETELDAALPACEMTLQPDYLSAAIFEPRGAKFGWGGREGEPQSAAFIESEPFTAFALPCAP